MHTRTHTALAACATLAALGLAAARPAAAAPTVFNLIYSGASYGNGATATGTITLDLSQVPNPAGVSNSPSHINSAVSALTLTVSGAATGNGTFTLSDYSDRNFVLDTNRGTLDYTRQLIGQPTSDLPFGTSIDGRSGNFNFAPGQTGVAHDAPRAENFFTIRTNTGSSDALRLTSFAPAPEPSPLASLGIGLLGLGALALRARKRSAA